MVLHGPGRGRYAIRKWYDFAIVALTILPALTPLRALRSARALKALKALRIVAFVTRGQNTAKQIWARTSGRHALVAAVGLITASAAGVWFFENDGGGIDSAGEAVWWTVVTMTTVGYGDISPTTGIGKALAVLVMLAGIAVFGVLTANLAAWFTSTEQQPQRDDLTAQIAELTTAVERRRTPPVDATGRP